MKEYAVKKLAIVWLVTAVAVGCGSSESEEPRTVAHVDAPSQAQVANLAYTGIYDELVQLAEGRFAGEPFVEGGTSRPTLQLVDGVFETGDLDRDGNDEAVVLLAENSGGSGTRIYVAAVGHKDGKVVNVATSLVGDRVQIRRVRVADGQVELEVVQQGPDDAACCPTQKVTRVWMLQKNRLVEKPPVVNGSLSIADLSGVEWVLTHFGWDEPAPAEPQVTLVFEGSRIAGSSGCNRYFGEIEESSPGAISTGPIGGTRMACPDDVMRLEDRYLKTIDGLVKYGFIAGKLALTCKDGESFTTLMFTAREAD